MQSSKPRKDSVWIMNYIYTEFNAEFNSLEKTLFVLDNECYEYLCSAVKEFQLQDVGGLEIQL